MTITQKEIETYMDGEKKLKKAQQKLTLVAAKLADQKASFEDRMLKGEKVQTGRYLLFMKDVFKRATIRWKEVVIELKGKLYAEELLAKAERKVVQQMVIIERELDGE